MIKNHLNTLYVSTEGAYLSKQGQAIVVSIDKVQKLRLPIHHIEGIVCLGRISMSPQAMAHCSENNVSISMMTEQGRLLARIIGFTSGNVLLRRQQYRMADDLEQSASIAGNIVAVKIANARSVLLRFLRDHATKTDVQSINATTRALAYYIEQARQCNDLDRLRGLEGDAAREYFNQFDAMITSPTNSFEFECRSRRPPLNPVNAMLSFVYSLLAHDVRSACETVGLDPAVGFLHRDRPGRPSLALDLMEELRAFFADRLVLTLINRQQVKAKKFTTSETGAVMMSDMTRKEILLAYQKRKQDSITHPFTNETITLGILPFIQAQLLARFIRGDIDAYPPFIWK